MSRKYSGRTGALAMLLGSALTISGLAVGTANAQTPAPATPAPAATTPAAPAAPAKPKLTVTGLVDGYYGYFGSNPKSLKDGITPDAIPPSYVLRNATPTLSLAELNVAMAPPSDGGFGFKGTFQVGDTPDLNTGGGFTDGTWESRYKAIGQLYAQWGFSKGGELDFGKFYTPFGYEVVESNANYNYTRSVPYQALLPIYHTGFRIISPLIGKGLTLTGEVVNSILDTPTEGVSDDNNDKGYIGQVNWTDPGGKYVFVETLGYSEDLLSGIGGPEDDITLSDTDLTWTPDAKNTFGGSFTYRQDDQQSGAPKITSSGWAVYYRNQLTSQDAVALRYSGATSKASGGSSATPEEVTATYEIKSSASWLTRFEYRHDFANVPLYVDSSGGTTDKSQDLGVVSEVYTFGP